MRELLLTPYLAKFFANSGMGAWGQTSIRGQVCLAPLIREGLLARNAPVINVENDANTLVRNMVVGGLATDVKIAGRWGIVSGHATNNALNGPEGALLRWPDHPAGGE